MIMNTISIGEKLKEYRLKKGLTPKAFAELVNLSTRYYVDIERGDKTPKLETFIRILNALEASADYVLQDNLVIGYTQQSNTLLKKLDGLNQTQKKQALDILDTTISTLKEK